MDARAVSILRGLANIPWIDVAFLIDASGHVLVSVGTSPAFSHDGTFPPGEPLAGEPETSLYITSVVPGIYLGILFEADAPIEDVRAEVTRVEAHLAAVVQ